MLGKLIAKISLGLKKMTGNRIKSIQMGTVAQGVISTTWENKEERLQLHGLELAQESACW